MLFDTRARPPKAAARQRVAAEPQFRNNNHDPDGGPAHLDPEGNLVVPPNTVLPPLVPFEVGK
jgi:hypothetical protein